MTEPHTQAETITVRHGNVTVVVGVRPDAPASLDELRVRDGASVVHPERLVEVFTAGERHDRMTLGYVGSAIGSRLRVVDVRVVDVRVGDVETRGGSDVDGEAGSDRPVINPVINIVQTDADTRLRVVSRVEVVTDGVRVTHEVTNDGASPIVLFALPSLTARIAAEPDRLTLVSGRGEWLGEGRWTEHPLHTLLPELGFASVSQPDRTGFGQSSSGGWSTGSVIPTGVLATSDEAAASIGVGWQIESSAGWQWSLSRGDGGVVLSAGGPNEREHHGEVRLDASASFTTVRAALVAAPDGARDGAFAALTRLRRELRVRRTADAALPVVYNDYMNTLMGQPSTAALRPLIDAAARAGAEVFCIDAGWFTDSTDYWSAVGAWEDAPTRFTGGLGAVIAQIRAAGMRPGLWLEPESVGLDSPVADALPDEAFFRRHGVAVVQQRRKHLDLRHPSARAHLDAVVDRIVAEHGIEYIKLDYNIEPGSGTDVGGLAPGHGLLEHTRALRSWLVDIQERHPALLVENCASGAMRSDYHLLAVTHIQSTSDQQDGARYAAIAAAAPATVLPEQSGNWAYPSVDMTDGELATTLVSGLSGRLYLAGFLDRLAPAAFDRVVEAVAFAKAHRADLATAEPFWPVGLPGWDDDVLALGQRLSDGGELLYVWSRGAAATLALPHGTDLHADVEQVFPAIASSGSSAGWECQRTADGHVLHVPQGPDAAVFRIGR